MCNALRFTTVLGLLAAAGTIYIYSQAKVPSALPQEHKIQPSMQAGILLLSGTKQKMMMGAARPRPVIFEDISVQAGLSHWTHVADTTVQGLPIGIKGSGIGLIDFDNDGWVDIYVLNASTINAQTGKATPPHAALFHNNHDGTFTDVAEKAGVTNDRWGMAVAIADYDNDGWPDIFVSNVGQNRLYHNNHDGTFTDVAERAGVRGGNWSGGAAWGDYDGDGNLDLFVAGYARWDWNAVPVLGNCILGQGVAGCGVGSLPGESNHLYHNNGDGTFTDVSVIAGVAGDPNGHRLSVVFADVNNDGKLDLLVGSDTGPCALYLNRGDGTFENVDMASGNMDGVTGIAVGDFENSGTMDVFGTRAVQREKPLLANDGNGVFTEVETEAGLRTRASLFNGWGAVFFDFDNDGWKDLMMTNGGMSVGENSDGQELPLLFRNVLGKQFAAVIASEGSGLREAVNGRGMAVGDLFNDGMLDVVINVLNGHPVLLKNVSEERHHWLEFNLVGGTRSPKDATGATVYLRLYGMSSAVTVHQREDVLRGDGYLSSSNPRVHFGWDEWMVADSVEVHWPSGRVERYPVTTTERILTLVEGNGRELLAMNEVRGRKRGFPDGVIRSSETKPLRARPDHTAESSRPHS